MRIGNGWLLLALCLAWVGTYAWQPAARHPPTAGPPLARGMLLVADQRLRDPNFVRSVILLLGYNEEGALGLVINRASRLPMAEMLSGFDALASHQEPVYVGGPVQPGVITALFHTPAAPPESMVVIDDLYVSRGAAALRTFLARNADGDRLRVYAGYAGWTGGQLESEYERGDWHVVEATVAEVLSDEPGKLWQRLIRRISGTWVDNPSYVLPRSAVSHAAPSASPARIRSRMGLQQSGQSS